LKTLVTDVVHWGYGGTVMVGREQLEHSGIGCWKEVKNGYVILC